MTHEPECVALGETEVERNACRVCRVAGAAYHRGYNRGYEHAEEFHEECPCHRVGTWAEVNGEVQWLAFDGVKFVPESIALAERQRGREDATRAIAEVVHDTIVGKKFVAGGLSDLPDLLTAIYYAGGGEQG